MKVLSIDKHTVEIEIRLWFNHPYEQRVTSSIEDLWRNIKIWPSNASHVYYVVFSDEVNPVKSKMCDYSMANTYRISPNEYLELLTFLKSHDAMDYQQAVFSHSTCLSRTIINPIMELEL